MPGFALLLSLQLASKQKSNVDTKIEITYFPHTYVVLLAHRPVYFCRTFCLGKSNCLSTSIPPVTPFSLYETQAQLPSSLFELIGAELWGVNIEQVN